MPKAWKGKKLSGWGMCFIGHIVFSVYNPTIGEGNNGAARKLSVEP